MYRRLIALSLLVAFTTLAQEAKPNFSGTWKCESLMPGMTLEIDRIEHKEPDITISERRRREDVAYGLTYRTDGGEPQKGRGMDGIERKAHWEGTTLVLDARWLDRGITKTQHQELSLSPDGKTMTKTTNSMSDLAVNGTIELKKISDGILGIKPGDSEATVRHEWGDPTSVKQRGDKTVFVYRKEWPPGIEQVNEVIFVHGQMTDIHGSTAKPSH